MTIIDRCQAASPLAERRNIVVFRHDDLMMFLADRCLTSNFYEDQDPVHAPVADGGRRIAIFPPRPIFGQVPELEMLDERRHIPRRTAWRRPTLALSFMVHIALVAGLWFGWQMLPPIAGRPTRDAMTVTFVTDRHGVSDIPGRTSEKSGAASDERKVATHRPDEHRRQGALAMGMPVAPSPSPSQDAGIALPVPFAPDLTGVPKAGLPPVNAPATAAAASATPESAEESLWEGQIVSRLQHRKRYPVAALHSGAFDTVLIRLVIGREGQLLDVQLADSRGIRALDNEALALAARASPYPVPPSSVTGDAIRLLIPIEFVIAGKH